MLFTLHIIIDASQQNIPAAILKYLWIIVSFYLHKEISKLIQNSDHSLRQTLGMDEEAAAEAIEKAHKMSAAPIPLFLIYKTPFTTYPQNSRYHVTGNSFDR